MRKENPVGYGDIKTLVDEEMKLFDLVIQAYPSLVSYKKKIRDQFLKHYILFFKHWGRRKSGILYLSNLLGLGITIRSLNLYRGCLWAFGSHNSHVFADSLRGQCESLALAHYCVNNPGYIPASMTGTKNHEDNSKKLINVLTMIEKLDKQHKGIKLDYESLSERVHPNPFSLLTNTRFLDESDISTTSTRMPLVPSAKLAERYLLMLYQWTEWLFKELDSLYDLNVP